MTQLTVNIIVDDKSFTIRANSGDCIEHVVDCLIKDRFPGSGDSIVLVWNGKELDDDRSLADYNVSDGASLQAKRIVVGRNNDGYCNRVWWCNFTLKMSALGDIGFVLLDIMRSTYNVWILVESPDTVMTFLKAVYGDLFYSPCTVGGAVGATLGLASFALLSRGIDVFFPQGVPEAFSQMSASLHVRMDTLKQSLPFLPPNLHRPNIEPVLNQAKDLLKKISDYHSCEMNRAVSFGIASGGAAVGTGAILWGCALGPFGFAAVLVCGLVVTLQAGSACYESCNNAKNVKEPLEAVKKIVEQLDQMNSKDLKKINKKDQ